MTGNSDPYGAPVAGLTDEGPVVPRQPPSRFVETTKIAIGVERLAGPDHAVPPAETLARCAVAIVGREPVPRAFGRGRSREAGRVRVAAQRVAHEDDVVPRGRQRAVRFVGDTDRVQLPPAVELERLGQIEEPGVDRPDRAGGGLRGWRGHPHDHIACVLGVAPTVV